MDGTRRRRRMRKENKNESVKGEEWVVTKSKFPTKHSRGGTRELGRVMHNNFRSFIFSKFKVRSYKKIMSRSYMHFA